MNNLILKIQKSVTLDKLKKFELYIFMFFLIINLLPIFIFKFLPTLDGPAHLHNSNIIKYLLFSDSKIITAFYELNNELIPNWIGHFLLLISGIFFPAFIADKILIAAYLIFLPLSFRWLIKTLSPDNFLLYILIFPFCYSFTFLLGFYNFSLALILFFTIVTFWIKRRNNLHFKHLILLFIFNIVLYFSHIFIFGITTFVVCIISLSENLTISEKNIKEKISRSVREISFYTLSIAPSLILGFKFFLSNKAINYSYISKLELLQWIKKIRPIIAYNFGREGVFTKALLVLILFLVFVTIYKRLKKTYNANKGFKNIISKLFHKNDIWLFCAFLIFILYFTMPDSNGYSGYFSVRLGLLFFLFLITWLSTQSFKIWIVIISLGIIFISNTGLTVYYATEIKNNNAIAIEVNNLNKLIDPYKIILPLNYSDNWLYGHYSNYIGIDKPVILLENYECGTGYFPVKWKSTNFPNNTIGYSETTYKETCIYWKSNLESNKKYIIDYIFILGKYDQTMDSCIFTTIKLIEKNYILISDTENTKLYKLLKSTPF